MLPFYMPASWVTNVLANSAKKIEHSGVKLPEKAGELRR
jgi:hypothetical protein